MLEYTRDIISTCFGVNDVGQRHFLDKAIRSFDRKPALLHTAFADIRPVNIRGMQVGAFTLDAKRIGAVMSACLAALHFRETGEKVQHWGIVLPNVGFSSHDTTYEEVGAWRQLFSEFARLPYQARATSAPDVFEYGAADIEGGRVYLMRFYKSYIVYGLKVPEADVAGTQPQ